jgi:hypothetical protein
MVLMQGKLAPKRELEEAFDVLQAPKVSSNGGKR